MGGVHEVGTAVVFHSFLSKGPGAMTAQSPYLYWGAPEPQGGFELLLNFGPAMNTVLMAGPVLPEFVQAWLVVTAGVAIGSLVLLRVLMGLASRHLRATWQQQPRLPLQTEAERKLFQPRYGLTLFRRWMHRLLERNPIGWLERRTWQGRVISWTWLAVVISL